MVFVNIIYQLVYWSKLKLVRTQHQYKKIKISYHYNNNQNKPSFKYKQFLKMNYKKMPVTTQHDSSSSTLIKINIF